MKRFRETAPLESFYIIILGELIRTPRGHRYIVVIKDLFKKLVKAIPMNVISEGKVAKLSVERWVFNYGPLTKLLSDNGSEFTSKFFQDVSHVLKTK